MQYHILTYGCQMNKSDSERIAAFLESDGYKEASKIEEADLIVVNMCSVRQSAVDRVFGLSQKFTKLRSQNPKPKIILTGCILQADKIKFKKFFDEIWEKKIFWQETPKRKKEIAFVPISNGCNFACTYCVIPFTKGRLIYRDHREILKEVEKAAMEGSKEIWLLGQIVNNYLSPIDPSLNFPKLIKMVNDLPGEFKFFFTSPHPSYFSDELIDALAESQKFGRVLNLPLQSGDDEILKRMGRTYTSRQYKELVKKIRQKMPDIYLSTDIIVGFPGETRKHFENTIKLVKEIKFDNAYIAKYSPRLGTAAFQMKDDVPLKEKKKREKILREIFKTK